MDSGLIVGRSLTSGLDLVYEDYKITRSPESELKFIETDTTVLGTRGFRQYIKYEFDDYWTLKSIELRSSNVYVSWVIGAESIEVNAFENGERRKNDRITRIEGHITVVPILGSLLSSFTWLWAYWKGYYILPKVQLIPAGDLSIENLGEGSVSAGYSFETTFLDFKISFDSKTGMFERAVSESSRLIIEHA